MTQSFEDINISEIQNALSDTMKSRLTSKTAS